MLLTFIEPLLDSLGPLLIRREDEDRSPVATNATIARLDARIASQLDALSLTGGACLSAYLGDEAHALAALAAWVVSTEPADHARAWTHLSACDLTKAGLMLGVSIRHGGPAWRSFVRAQFHAVLVAVCGEVPAPIAQLEHDVPFVRAWAWRHLARDLAPTDAQIAAACADPSTQDACVAQLCQRRDPRLQAVLRNNLRWAARLADADVAPAVADKLWADGDLLGLASLGRPADLDRLIEVLAHPDPVTAVAAGVAFTQLTGADIASEQRVLLPVGEGEDPAFADDAWLPDQHRARKAWLDLKPKLGDAARIARGYRVDDPEHPELPRSAREDLLLRRCRNE